MPLDKDKLKADIRSAMETAASASDPNQREAVLTALIDSLATAIESYVKGGTVRVIAQPGEISVEGTPAAQHNSFPITITGTVE